MKPYTLAIAGSTEHTVICAQALLKNPEFQIVWTLTPTPKPIGRTQTLTENPLHSWSQQNQISTILVTKKIDDEIKTQITDQTEKSGKPDFLLVVDFGYLIPDWLLDLPAIAPLNIHPSLLPKWRGSSPGQFALLYGDKNSAVTLMEMNAGLDTGPLLYQEQFAVDPTWTQTEYYEQSFKMMERILAEKIIEFAKTGQKTEQSQLLPMTVARRLKKEDGFIEWNVLKTGKLTQNGLLLQVMTETHQPQSQVIEQAVRALSPWPGVWTMISTAKGEKRMQILATHLEDRKEAEQHIILDRVKIEGQAETAWTQVRNQVLEK